jgi:dienelactone hydrolase
MHRGDQGLEDGRVAVCTNISQVAAIGFCYGGWAVFQLAALSPPLLSCISTAHPALLTHDEIRAVKIPVQIVAPEFDDYMSLEMKAFCNKEIPKAGVVYSYMHFPGVHHGFAGRGDKENPLQKGSLERAGRVMAGWCREWLYN